MNNDLKKRVEEFLQKDSDGSPSMSFAEADKLVRDLWRIVETVNREDLERLQYFEACINEGPAVVFRWVVKPGEWRVEMVSDNVKQFGYEPEDFTSGRVSWPAITHPDDGPRLEKEVAGYLEKGVPEFGQCYRLFTKSGEARWVQDRNIVITDAKGIPTHIQGVVTDVTKLREAEDKGRESEERYRRLFEAEADAILLLDVEKDCFVDVNQAALALYGYTKEEFLSLTPWDITAEPEETAENIHYFINGQNMKMATIRYHRKKDGTLFPVEVSPSRFIMDGKTVICGIIRDVTERKNMEDARIYYQRRLRKLAAKLANAQDAEQRRIAHGLHDEVAQLLASANIKLNIARNCSDPRERQKAIDETEQALLEADERVHSLSFELNASTLQRGGLINGIKELIEKKVKRYGIRFELEVHGHIPRLEEEMKTVLFKSLRELMFNVVKHAKTENGWVKIYKDEGVLNLTVEDKGAGFQQAIDGSKLQLEQRGLGLFGVRELISDIGGTLRVESEPAVGTRVTISVPIDKDKRRS